MKRKLRKRIRTRNKMTDFSKLILRQNRRAVWRAIMRCKE